MDLFKNRKENPRLVVREVFAGHSDPDRAAVVWSQSVANDRGLDPRKDQLRLIRELRKRDSSLSLTSATFMAEEASKS